MKVVGGVRSHEIVIKTVTAQRDRDSGMRQLTWLIEALSA